MGNPIVVPQWKVIEETARSFGIEPQLLDVRRPEDLRGAFDAAAKQRLTIPPSLLLRADQVSE